MGIEIAGFSAQNIEKYIPEGVSYDNRGYRTLNDRAIMATMVNAIKELNTKVKEQEQEIKKLNSTTKIK